MSSFFYSCRDDVSVGKREGQSPTVLGSLSTFRSIATTDRLRYSERLFRLLHYQCKMSPINPRIQFWSVVFLQNGVTMLRFFLFLSFVAGFDSFAYSSGRPRIDGTRVLRCTLSEAPRVTMTFEHSSLKSKNYCSWRGGSATSCRDTAKIVNNKMRGIEQSFGAKFRLFEGVSCEWSGQLNAECKDIANALKNEGATCVEELRDTGVRTK